MMMFSGLDSCFKHDLIKNNSCFRELFQDHLCYRFSRRRQQWWFQAVTCQKQLFLFSKRIVFYCISWTRGSRGRSPPNEVKKAKRAKENNRNTKDETSSSWAITIWNLHWSPPSGPFSTRAKPWAAKSIAQCDSIGFDENILRSSKIWSQVGTLYWNPLNPMRSCGGCASKNYESLPQAISKMGYQ